MYLISYIVSIQCVSQVDKLDGSLRACQSNVGAYVKQILQCDNDIKYNLC